MEVWIQPIEKNHYSWKIATRFLVGEGCNTGNQGAGGDAGGGEIGAGDCQCDAVDVEGVSDNAASRRIYEFILINWNENWKNGQR